MRSSPSVHQRRHDRSRIHRSLWPSHPASAYPRCLHITQQGRERSAEREKRERRRQSEAKATQSYVVLAPYTRESRGSWRQVVVERLPPPPPLGDGDARRTTVLSKRDEGHRTHRVMVGIQTHTHTHTDCCNQAHWICVRVNPLKADYSNWSRPFLCLVQLLAQIMQHHMTESSTHRSAVQLCV